MSLHTDSVFISAISSDTALMGKIGGRLYGTAIPMPDEDADNTPVPYIIVTFDGLTNDNMTKDDEMESIYDTVSIGIQVVAASLSALHELTQDVRDAVRAYIATDETIVNDYTFSAASIQYDSWKPCYWQTLRYQCDVTNLIEEDED